MNEEEGKTKAHLTVNFKELKSCSFISPIDLVWEVMHVLRARHACTRTSPLLKGPSLIRLWYTQNVEDDISTARSWQSSIDVVHDSCGARGERSPRNIRFQTIISRISEI